MILPSKKIVSKCTIEFVSGYDKEGNEIRYGINEAQENNKWLLPIYFRREVLKKYYDDHEKFEVMDGVLHARKWQLRLDNHELESVKVSLGDLFQCFNDNENEFLHWKQYNYVPTYPGGYSEITRARWGKALPEESNNPEFQFKKKYHELQSHEIKLLKETRGEDHYLLQSMHIPCRNTQEEFDSQILILCKLTIDHLNQDFIKTFYSEREWDVIELKMDGSQWLGSIGMLEKWLEKMEPIDSESIISFLKALQDARSKSAAHKKRSNHPGEMQKIYKKMGLDEKQSTLPLRFYEILGKAIDCIIRLKSVLDKASQMNK